MVKNNCCCEKIFLAQDSKKSPISFIENETDFLKNYFCLRWKDYGVQKIIVIEFCPWCGKELEKTFELNLKDKLSKYLDYTLLNQPDFVQNIPAQLQHLLSREWFDNEIYKQRNFHKLGSVCEPLKYQTEESFPIIYIPNIRVYGILHRKKYKGFTAIDYCIFCGAKLPNRLDEQLSDILKKEHGISSWRNYKKAPEEFHSDEWWRKRGL